MKSGVPSEQSDLDSDCSDCSMDTSITDISAVYDQLDQNWVPTVYEDDMDEVLLFVYGTLMSPRLWRKVSGMANHPIHTKKAVLNNYVGLKVENEAYPGLIARSGERVIGQILSIKSSKLLEKIDRYEDDFYTRITVQVSVEERILGKLQTEVFEDDKTLADENISCEAYLWNNKMKLEKVKWDYNEFVEYYQDAYLAEL